MKIYYYYVTDEILTEEEAKAKCQKDALDDDYSLWNFIIDNYPYEEILEALSKNFLEEAVEQLAETQLEDPEYFLVREISD